MNPNRCGFNFTEIGYPLSKMCRIAQRISARTPNSTNNAVTFLTSCCSEYQNRTGENLSKVEHYKKVCQYANLVPSYNGTTRDLKCNMEYVGQSAFDTTSLYIFVGLVSPIGILANLLVLEALRKTTRARNNATLFYIRHLAVADLLAIGGLIIALLVYHGEVVGSLPESYQRFLFSSFDIFVGSASLMQITAVSMDRAFAILYPIKHLSRATKSRTKKVVIALWLFSLKLLVMALLRIVIHDKSYADFVYIYAMLFTFFIPCFLVITAYAAIIVTVVNANFERIKANIRASPARTPRCREIKLAFHVTIIIIPYMCGWGYCMILAIYEKVNHVIFTGIINWFIVTIPFLVSCINPLIYLLCTASLKKYSLRLIRQWCKCKLFRPSDIFKTTSFRSSQCAGENSKENTTVFRASIDGNEIDICGPRRDINDTKKEMLVLLKTTVP